MSLYLSSTQIISYCGNVVPLRLISESDISHENIRWYAEGDCISIRDFAGEGDFCFNDGILVTLSKEGEGKIVCEYKGEKYICRIVVNKRRTANAESELKPYPADLHIHTSNDHNSHTFALRQEELPYQCIETTLASGAVECSVLTDHASTTNDRDFFRGFVDEEQTPHDGLVVFPGCESEVTLIEKDRFGLSHKNSGEIVTLNACNYSDTQNWDGFYRDMKDSPFAVASLAHPSVVGWDSNGIWNFCLYKNAQNPEFRHLVRLTETGRGNYSESSMLYHYTYSQALDCGLRISPCSTSDSHGKYEPVCGKTFILSSEKSKEMFYDAIVNNRVYACDSGAVDLRFTVNGCIMGQTLKDTNTYSFHVEASLLKDVEGAMPVKCTVISDYGKKIKTMPFDGKTDFVIKSDSARYFYILLTDTDGRKTWSSPVWTGREFDDLSVYENLKPIDKKEFDATDEKRNTDAKIIINDNPTDLWDADDETASVIIDMKEIREISAVGHYAPPVFRYELMEANISITSKVTEYVSEYRISVSCDGKEYREVKRGFVRAFGGEDILAFEPAMARYVKFEALSSVGKDTERKDLSNAKIKIGELTIFER